MTSAPSAEQPVGQPVVPARAAARRQRRGFGRRRRGMLGSVTDMRGPVTLVGPPRVQSRSRWISTTGPGRSYARGR